MIEPVSRPISLSEGVRGTSGRPLPAHLVAERQPQLGEQAVRLLETLPRKVTGPTAAKFAESLVTSPSRPGEQALAYLAWCFREAARKKYPEDAVAEGAVAEALEKLRKGCAAAVDVKETGERLTAAVTVQIASALVAAFDAGKQTAQKELEADSSRPVRRTEFVSDSAGRIVGKNEYELKPGGKT